MNPSSIDLDRAEQAVASLSKDEALSPPRHAYRSSTLHPVNDGRVIYLPIFPVVCTGTNESLLLANVPGLSFADR